MQRYRSGYNGPDSKSGVLATVPWVRIPPAALRQNALNSLLFPQTETVEEFRAFFLFKSNLRIRFDTCWCVHQLASLF